MNPIFTDPWDPLPTKKNDTSAPGWLINSDGISKDDRNYPDWELMRLNMGYTLRFANQIDLNKMVPRSDLSSTTYCLADDSTEYLIYFPEGGNAKINLQNAGGNFRATWYIPLLNKTVEAPKRIEGKSIVTMEAPTALDAVLHLARD